MHIQIMGTAAYERVPAMFCRCPACLQAIELGGKNIRTQAQTLINDDLLVDFGQDNYIHFLRAKKDYTKLKNILITHPHSDHYRVNEFVQIGSCYGHNDITDPIVVWGNDYCAAKFAKEDHIEKEKCTFRVVKPYETFTAGKYTVTSLPANHGSGIDPMCYIISDGEKTLLYNHDTGFFFEDVYDFLEKGGYHFDGVILDCTCGFNTHNGNNHMSFGNNLTHKERLMKMGVADEKTVWVVTHFSHNGLYIDGKPQTAEQMEAEIAKHGMICAYDGIEIDI